MTRNSVLGSFGADGESNAMEVGSSSGVHTNQKSSQPPPPQRGVVARRSSRLGEPNNNSNTSTLAQMVRISSRAAKRGAPLLPGTRRTRTNSGGHQYYRFLVVLVGSVVTVLSVGCLLLVVLGTTSTSSPIVDPTRTARTVELGPDGQIVHEQQHQQQRDPRDPLFHSQHHLQQNQRPRHPHTEREEESKEGDDQTASTRSAASQEEEEEEQKRGDDRQGEDDQQKVTEGGEDDGVSADTTTRQQQGEEEDEEEDEDDDKTGGQHRMKMASIWPAHRVLSMGLPYLLYGTAWKKDDTARLVQLAVTAGFRFIDTACQPKHYHEPGVGDGWTVAANELSLDRHDLFLQTKYTSVSGQDPDNIPYDPTLPLPDQVAESLQVSLRNLRTTYIDSWVMHGLESTLEDTMVVYRAMERAVDDGRVKRLGISNCYDLDKFKYIYDNARIKPEILQNRFYGDSQWDIDLRRFCKKNDIWYQSFWTLTANRKALQTREVMDWAARKQLTPQTLLYAYLMNLGYGTPLDGTTNWDHMLEDVAVMRRMQKEFQGAVADEDKIFSTAQEMRDFERLLGF